MHQVYLPEHFIRQLKSYRKKYRHFEEDLVRTLENFQPELSDRLGNKLYKVRMKSRDLPRGKSKSFRIIIFLVEIKKLVVPLTLYFKGDQQDVSGKEIEYHLQIVLEEIQKNKIKVIP